MKSTILVIGSMFLFVLMTACTAQNSASGTRTAEMLDKGAFIFVAENANPTNYDVVKVMNSFPNTSAGQMLRLDPAYTVEINEQQLSVTLPYFGRLYRANMDPDKNSYRFTSKDFSADRSAGKKGSIILTLKVNDQPNVQRIIMEIYPNSKTYVAIDANDRQPISYSGYIMEVPEPGVKK